MRSAYDLEVDRGQDWRLSAACRGEDPEMWTLFGGTPSASYRRAHEICAACPVRARCEAYAVDTNSWGMIFGGRDFSIPAPRDGVRLVCERCGRLFNAVTRRARYCSHVCRQKDYEQRQRVA